MVGKITDDYITVGEYTNEEEFGDSDLSSYILNDNFYPNGSSVYYKDSIVLYCKSYNIENIEDVFVSKLSDRVKKKVNPNIFVGFIDFEVHKYRNPRA